MEVSNIKSLQNGCHDTFSAIFDTHWDKVYYYLLTRTKDIDHAIELTQQVFIKLWRYKDSLSEDIPLDKQLFRKSRQIYIDWLRQESRKREYLIGIDETYDVPHPSDAESIYSLKYDLEKAIESLPKKRKQIFELKHIYGYSYKEIAEYLGISVKTVDNQLLKANIQLRKILSTSICIVLGEHLIK